MIEAGELLVESQKHYETQRNKAEQLMREKASVIGEFQSIQDLLQAELDKAKFDLRELEVTAETLRIENKQMVQEISEISGDAAVDRSAVHKGSHNNNASRNVINPDAFGTADVTYDESSKDASISVSRDRKSISVPGESLHSLLLCFYVSIANSTFLSYLPATSHVHSNTLHNLIKIYLTYPVLSSPILPLHLCAFIF